MKKKQNEIVSPVARQMSNLPEARSFEEVLQLIQAAKQRAYQAVNTEIITLYWQVGEYIGRKIETDGWGKGTIQNLGSYLNGTNLRWIWDISKRPLKASRASWAGTRFRRVRRMIG